jgi:glycogen synthase
MKVLMTADTVGGVWQYAIDLAAAMVPHGMDVSLATMGRKPDGAQRVELRRSAFASVHASGFALEWQHDPWDDVEQAGAWLLELEEKLQPDLIHLNGYVHGSLPWSAPVVIVAHSDVLAWWRAVHGEPAPANWERYRQKVEEGLRAATAVCAPTQAVLDDLDSSYAFDTRRFLVPNGRAISSDVIGSKESVAVGLGRFWDDAKNLDALERISERSPWPLVLAGPGTVRGRLTTNEVKQLLARAAIFVSPARYEPFGLAALEAAHAGCALLLGDIPSLREVWGEAACYAPPCDEEALLAQLSRLMLDEPYRLELASRAQHRARRYTPAAAAARMVSVYDAALAAARQTASVAP